MAVKFGQGPGTPGAAGRGTDFWGGDGMRTRRVEITCARDGVKSIHVDGEELDIRYIEGKPIESWFKPAQERRSSWKGLAEELRDKLGDENAVFSFEFFGPKESEAIFFQCLQKQGLATGELTQEDVIRRHLENGRKAWHRRQFRMAFQFYQKAAALNSPEGLYALGMWYAAVLDLHPDPQASVSHSAEEEEWRNAALEAHPSSAGMEQNLSIAAKSLELLEQAAELGWTPAQKTLYDFLWGYQHPYWNAEIPRDEEEAVRWLTAAAEGGDPEAQAELARYQEAKERRNREEQGEIELDVSEEIRKQAEQGDPEAQYEMALAYDRQCEAYTQKTFLLPTGDNHAFSLLDRSLEAHKQALQWYRAAAEQGHSGAAAFLKDLDEKLANPDSRYGTPYLEAAKKAASEQEGHEAVTDNDTLKAALAGALGGAMIGGKLAGPLGAAFGAAVVAAQAAYQQAAEKKKPEENA